MSIDRSTAVSSPVSRRARKARRSRSLSNLDLPIPVSKPFAQNAVAVLDRITLNLVRHLPIGVGRRLIQAADDVRRGLGLGLPTIQLRDWPQDPETGYALKTLLRGLAELEPSSEESEELEG